MADVLATAMADIRGKSLRIAIAAIVATVVLQMMMQIGAPNMLGIAPMEPANLITSMLGLPVGHVLGRIAHFGLGLVGFPLGYMVVAYRHFPGNHLLKGALWGALLWLVAMLVVLPLASQPLFFGFGKPMVAALVAHVVYGIVLAAIIGKPAPVTEA